MLWTCFEHNWNMFSLIFIIIINVYMLYNKY
jgi:hypothetical protein